MEDFFFVVLIGFSAAWGSVYLGHRLWRSSKQINRGPSEQLIDEVREETALLARKIVLLEEEVKFFRALHEPKSASATIVGETEE